MANQRIRCLALLVLFAVSGCGKIPLISPNRKNFPPWEKLPEGNGIRYVEKLTRDPGIDPFYLAKMTYHDGDALQLVLDTFGLVPRDETHDASTFTSTLGDSLPAWFPLDGVTHVYVYPSKPNEEYVSNLWVNADEKIMILERAWW
ncbi:MAG: hypothetical protein KDA87_18130 [Planctomycetales bacterium]|nr:hypothetical protein [Planctomycetales bacterium]